MFSKQTDAQFHVTVNNVIPYLAANDARLGTATYTASLSTLLGDWNNYYPQSQNPNLSTQTIREEKDDTRRDIESMLSSAYHDIPDSVLTDADKNSLYWSERDTEPTPVAVNDKAPVVYVITMSHLSAVLKFENPNNSDKRALPAGNFILLETYVGPTPVQEGQQLMAVQVNIPFGNAQLLGKSKTTIQFQPQDQGKTAWIRACYTNRRGEKSPYSIPVSFVIN